jgi:uncharacterized membrane protein YfcA
MSAGDWLLLVVAGVTGGLAGSIAGLASLTTYPALLAVGLGPVAANVTNTVALVFSSAGSVSGSRPELTGQGTRVRRLGVAALPGGTTGCALLRTAEPLPISNALKNTLLGVANAVAALGFALLAPVEWLAILPLSVGLFAGARLGPVVVRHAPAGALRLLIGGAGLALAVVLAVEAY